MKNRLAAFGMVVALVLAVHSPARAGNEDARLRSHRGQSAPGR
jgi:hypothetical protein